MELLKQLEPVGLEKRLLHSDGFLSKSLVQIWAVCAQDKTPWVCPESSCYRAGSGTEILKSSNAGEMLAFWSSQRGETSLTLWASSSDT